ncbi:UDP-N-acetylglucosamine 2-epimerase, partial [Gammaproteobacteria bacterium]|nr:UDP-N-acetylglucosamine 2-epimerase [Gammaproteobacteria bacterium]
AYDDSFRHCITKLSYLHGASTETHRNRIIQLGEEPERVVNVGALGLDHLERTSLMSLSKLSKSLQFELKKPYLLVTYHPVTLANEEPIDSVNALLDALDKFPSHQVVITYPNADNGGLKIIPRLTLYEAERPGRVLVVPSLGQIRYLSAIKHASAVVGNSSSGIIEVPSLNVPTVNIGQRQNGRLSAKSVLHCAASTDPIVKCIEQAITRRYKKDGEKIVNPYGRGNASSRVIEMIKSLEFSPMKKFYDLEV